MQVAAMTTAKKPKRRNAPKTKAKILDAAQQAFAETGYAQAGIREIAAIADVSSTLLLRYYGSKAGLFEAALLDAMRVAPLFAMRREHFGEHIAAQVLNADVEIKPPSMIALSTGDADARDIAARVTREHVVAPLAKWLGPPDANARAAQIVILAIGFALFTRQIPLTAQSGEKKLAKWFAQTIQAIVDRS
jgi:AcrR family transcriptional regulator